MHYWNDDMSGWDWLWGTLTMGLWVVLIGLVVYVAVKFAQGDRERKSHP